MLASFQVGLLALRVLTFSDLQPGMQRLMAEAGIDAGKLTAVREEIRARNQQRLRDGELEHLVNYVLQSDEFTKAEAVLPGRAALDATVRSAIRQRVSDFVAGAPNANSDRFRYLLSLLPAVNREDFVRGEIDRVLAWTREKEVACRTASDPQRCVSELYQTRGHSSDTGAQSNEVLRSALAWLGQREIRRVLIIGPGVDIAGRAGGSSGRTYQPQFIREAFKDATVDCVDLNDRVVKAVARICDSALKLDIAVEALDATYDLIIATNVLLYFNQQELMLAFTNVGAMLASGGAFVHNDGRFEANLFGRAAGMPVVHFGSVTLDSARRPALIDRFVIHSPSAQKGSTAPR
jgi:hypothetical protein